MNVFSKLSPKRSLVSKRPTIPSFHQLGYNKCDNPYCNYQNGLQSVQGRFNCLGPVTSDVPEGGFKLSKTNVSLSASGIAKSDDDSLPERCAGTYLVTAEQAEFMSHLFCTHHTEHSKRTRRDMAGKKAAREARYRAQKLAAEVEKDFEREFALRKVRAKEQAKKQKLEKAHEAEEPIKQDEMQEIEDHSVEQNETQELPVRRLKRETRRLPVTIKTGAPGLLTGESFNATVDSDGHQPSSSVAPLSPTSHQNIPKKSSSQSVAPPLFLRRRLSESRLTRPKQTGILWDSSIPDTLRASSRRAQYPPARGRMNSLDSILRAGEENNEPVPQPRVSTKNGITITHFGTLLPTIRRPHEGADKENDRLGQKRSLVLESRNKHVHRSDVNRSTNPSNPSPSRRGW